MPEKSVSVRFFVVLSMLILGVFVFSSITATNVTGQAAQVIDEPTVLFLPLIQKNFDASLGTPLFGVQMYGDTSSTSKYHPYLIGSTASWVRVAVGWQNAEPVMLVPPVYNWSGVDTALAAASEEMGQKHVIGTIAGIPESAQITYSNPPGKIIRRDKRDEFAAFVTAVVERYDGDGLYDAPGSPVILHWELTNEPDASAGSQPLWGNYGAEYAHLLSVTYPAIKNANPDAQVLIGGIAHDWFDDQGGNFKRSFLSDVLAAGGGAYFDVMNFHAYPAFASNWTVNNGPGLLEKTQAIRSILASYGYNKPMVVTEAGWHDNYVVDLPSSPEIQARYLVQLFTQSYAAHIETMIWWMLHDAGGNYPYDNGLVSLQNTNGVETIKEKISYKAYQVIVDELEHAHFVKKLSVAQTNVNEMEAYQFVDHTNNLTIYVAWLNPVNTSTTKPLKLSASQAVVRESVPNQVGGELRTYIIRDGDDGVINGEITIAVGGRPLYIEMQK